MAKGLFLTLSLNIEKSFSIFKLSNGSSIHSEDIEVRKILLRDNAVNQFSRLSDKDSFDSINTLFWLSIDPNNNISKKNRINALNSKKVTPYDLYQACKYQDNPITDYVLAGYEYAWAGTISAIAGTVPMSSAVTLGLFAFEKAATFMIANESEAKVQAQRDLCDKLVLKYYLSDSANKSFLESDNINSKTLIPFGKNESDLISDSSVSKVLKKTLKERSSISGSEKTNLIQNEDFYKRIIKEQVESYQQLNIKLDDYIKNAKSASDKQLIAANLEFSSNERQASIYLAQVLISKIFNGENLSNKFSILANSINKIYSTYEQYTLTQTLTWGATANYVGASLAIMSLFSNSDKQDRSVYDGIIKQIHQLTSIVIKGFDNVQYSQIEILKSLQNITNIAIQSHEIQVTLLTEIGNNINAFRADYNNDELLKIENNFKINIIRLNNMFLDINFNINNISYREKFENLTNEFVFHGTITASDSRLLSGFTNNCIIEDLISKFEKTNSFEYIIGTFTVVHNSISSIINSFSPAQFTADRVPNPLEWSRAFYLYYQSVFSTGLRNKLVLANMNAFLIKGNIIKEFCIKYTSPQFVQEVVTMHEIACNEFIKNITDELNDYLNSNEYYLYQYLINYVDSTYSSPILNMNDYYINNGISMANNSNFITTTSFVVTSSLGAPFLNPELNYGYYVNYNIMKCIRILLHLGVLEDYKIPNYFSESDGEAKQLHFKESPVICYISYLDKPFYHSYAKSWFFAGSNDVHLKDLIARGSVFNFESVLNKSIIPSDYWKTYPDSDITKDNKQVSNDKIRFTDFFRNEVFRAESIKRYSLMRSFTSKRNSIFLSNKGLINKIDSLGYLLSGSLTANNFMGKYQAIFAYINNYSSGINNTTRPIKASFSFAQDIFDALINTASEDIYNVYYRSDALLSNIKKYRYNVRHDSYSIPTLQEVNTLGYSVVNFAVQHIKLKLQAQKNEIISYFTVEDAGMSINNINFNVNRILNEIELFLKQ